MTPKRPDPRMGRPPVLKQPIRLQHVLTKELVRKLDKRAKRENITRSELIRRILSEHV